jgi:serine/threonine protein kinase/class 3 adenylate cyclase/tetratricopeptide (TPR) repeat protein
MIDTKLGPYRITEEIGTGGMATVYRAYQPSMDRHVAIKVIRGNILLDPTLRNRFRREARLIARLEHPHLLPVYDFDGDHDPPYIVMRYLEGGTLRQVLAQGTLPHDEMLYMLNQIAGALDYAHRQGVVHRDLKPSNIMIDREGNAFVTDFGIARAAGSQEDLTGTGVLVGTPGYMSPEQAEGKPDVDKAADIYSLGVMVFEMLTGTLPYTHDSGLAVLLSHMNDPIPSARQLNDRLSPEVDDVVRTAMAKKREERYPTAEALVSALAAALKVSSAQSPAQLQSLTQTLSVDQLKAFAAQGRRTKDTPSSATPSETQRQMTTVYLGVTELAEVLYESGLDAESARGRIEALWKRFDEIAREGGGVVQSRTDEVGVALWGRARISEDDPERAIRAALRMRSAALEAARGVLGKTWEPTEENPLPFAAGISTGPVLLERLDDTGTYSASGSTITLAGRLREAAPPGAILVAHDTFTQVRGVFTFHPHDPIRIRGRKEPLEVYTVTAVKPRAFRTKARGIEGVETKMIGREIELRILQEALTLTMEDGETQVVTVVGEAGVGKSRLLYEFSTWSDLIEQQFWLFQARATQPSMLQPYSLARDLFSFRFQILDSDPLEVVYKKFVDGVAGFLGTGIEEKAELIGQLVGFDFSARPSVAEALKDPDGLRHRALEHLGEFFTTASKTHPIVLHVEDIHWADDRSLDLINNLVRENTKLPLFVICMARPSLYERRPQWGEGQRFHERIQLEPLSQLSSRRLVRELLKKVPEVPPELRDLVVERADGNPFYIEELVRALIDDGVIVKGEQEWKVDKTRLSSVRIPPTLTGVLQSRLDTLSPPLQALLGRVSVVGRIFWDAAAVHLSRDAGLDEDETQAMLEELRALEMVLRREESGFAGTVEYVFRHAILRDVTYDTIVPRQRRAFHKLVGDWLLEMGGERAGEHTLLVAEHYGHAGEPVLAAEQLLRAGNAATALGTYDEATLTLRKARELVADKAHRAVRLKIDAALGDVLGIRGNLAEAREFLEGVLAEVRETGDRETLVRTLGQLSRLAVWMDDPAPARKYLEEALPITRELGDPETLLFVLRQMGNLLVHDAEKGRPYLEESLNLARSLGDKAGEASASNSIGNLVLYAGDTKDALTWYHRSLELSREIGQPFLEGMVHENLGQTYGRLREYDKAEAAYKAALKVAHDIGEKVGQATIPEGLGWIRLLTGDDAGARGQLMTALEGYRRLKMKPATFLVILATLEARTGDRLRALEWLGLARARAETSSDKSQVLHLLERHSGEIRGDLPPAEADAAMQRGAGMSLDAVYESLFSRLEGA